MAGPNLESQILNKTKPKKQDLYEYELEPQALNPELDFSQVLAFRKYGFGGVGNFHSFVT